MKKNVSRILLVLVKPKKFMIELFTGFAEYDLKLIVGISLNFTIYDSQDSLRAISGL
jgi:hypothetical protein